MPERKRAFSCNVFPKLRLTYEEPPVYNFLRGERTLCADGRILGSWLMEQPLQTKKTQLPRKKIFKNLLYNSKLEAEGQFMTPCIKETWALSKETI